MRLRSGFFLGLLLPLCGIPGGNQEHRSAFKWQRCQNNLGCDFLMIVLTVNGLDPVTQYRRYV